MPAQRRGAIAPATAGEPKAKPGGRLEAGPAESGDSAGAGDVRFWHDAGVPQSLLFRRYQVHSGDPRTLDFSTRISSGLRT